MDWRRYWKEYPRRFAPDDYLRQVKNTIGGRPIDSWAWQATGEATMSGLDLRPESTVLDLCCGNGLLTQTIARRCRLVVGIDFSSTLLDIARTAHQLPNVRYLEANVLDLATSTVIPPGPFDRILMSGGLQYFKRADLLRLLGCITPLIVDTGLILLTAIPDRRLKRLFYDTRARRLRYTWDRICGRDELGTWWDHAEIEAACAALGLVCERRPTRADTGSRYRFDITIRPGPTAPEGQHGPSPTP